jgi:hypothetical protein
MFGPRHRPLARPLGLQSGRSEGPSAPIRANIIVVHAINPGEDRSLTVTRGQPALQVRPCDSPDGADSQADSAGSIPVTRSKGKSPGQSRFGVCALLPPGELLLIFRAISVPLACGSRTPADPSSSSSSLPGP